MVKPIIKAKTICEYDGIIPWDYKETHKSLLRERLKIVFFTITLIAPIRFLLMIIVAIFGAIPCLFVISNKDEPICPTPLSYVQQHSYFYFTFCFVVCFTMTCFYPCAKHTINTTECSYSNIYAVWLV